VSAEIFVYELIDPRTSKVFYVGKGRRGRASVHIIEARRWMRTGDLSTLSSPNLHKLRVIRKILLVGLEPIIKKVRCFDEDEEAYLFEANLIQHYGLKNLTNAIPGGPAGAGPCPIEVRKKISRANKGKKRSAEACRRISAGLRGRPVSKATRKKMRAAKLGKKQSPEHIAKVVSANCGRAKHPLVGKICCECGEFAPHRQRRVKSGRLWTKPRCVDCEYARHRQYIDSRIAVKK
jgi:hypothetical protein